MSLEPIANNSSEGEYKNLLLPDINSSSYMYGDTLGICCIAFIYRNSYLPIKSQLWDSAWLDWTSDMVFYFDSAYEYLLLWSG